MRSIIRSMLHRLRRWRQCTWGQRWLVLRAWALLPLLGLGIRLVGYQRMRSWLAWTLPTASEPKNSCRNTSADIEQAMMMGQLVNGAARRGLFRANCLARSLLVWWLLGRQGIASEVVIGAQLEQGEFQAHAWVECQHRVINDRPDVAERFRAFTLPAGWRWGGRDR